MKLSRKKYNMDSNIEREQDKRAQEVFDSLIDITNHFGSREALSKIAIDMSNTHHTLVQSFTSGFIIPFVREMAKRKREGIFDKRDQLSADACEAMSCALDKLFGKKESDNIVLPMI